VALDSRSSLEFMPGLWGVALAPDVFAVLGERVRRCLKGSIAVAVGRAIDGTRSIEDIVTLVEHEHAATNVRTLISDLLNKGYIRAKCPPIDPNADIFWSNQKAASSDTTFHMSHHVSIRSLEDVPVDPLRMLLGKWLDASGTTENAVEIVVAGDYLHPDLEQLSREYYDAGRSWILLNPVGLLPMFGPLFAPGSACWECLAHRLRLHRYLEIAMTRDSLTLAPRKYRGFLPSSLASVYGMFATELLKLLTNRSSALASNSVITIDLDGLEIGKHALTRRPQCRLCGSPQTGPTRAYNPLPHGHTIGRRRREDRDDPLIRYAHHVSPITGVVREVTAIDVGEWSRSVHLCSGGLNLARKYDVPTLLSRRRANYSYGRGITADQARRSAFGEAVERYSCVFDGTEPCRLGSRRELGERAIRPNECMLFSQRQFDERRSATGAGVISPEPLDDTATISWSYGWSLSADESRYIPTALCYLDAETSSGHEYCAWDSTGAAAGATFADAVWNGVLEVVERDAASIWWYNKVPVPYTTFSHVRSAVCRDVQLSLAALGRDVWLCDITTDLGVPVYVALSCISGGRDLWLGFGADFDRGTAALRAVTELCQQLPSFNSPNCAGQTWSLDTFPFARSTKSDSHIRVRPRKSGSSLACINRFMKTARCEGLDVVVTDLTRPDIAMPVVKVFIPGMRPSAPRFAAGRLFDVPVRQRWRSSPTPEIAMNTYALHCYGE